jgi:hypothetical protein
MFIETKGVGMTKKVFQTSAHNLQDDFEIYTVYLMQKIAEDAKKHITVKSASVLKDFESALAAHGLNHAHTMSGDGLVYRNNLIAGVNDFMDRLFAKMPDNKFDFTHVAKELRNQNKKGDIVITVDDGSEISLSLKNYKTPIGTIQVSSGTFQSFIVNFLFEAAGVGTWINPVDNTTFNNRNAEKRNAVLVENGYASVVTMIDKMDTLSKNMRTRFIDSEEFRFYSEQEFDKARKDVGLAGLKIAKEFVDLLPAEIVKARLLKMTGFDGNEDILILGKGTVADSITDEAFQELSTKVRNANIVVTIEGQSLVFAFQDAEGIDVLRVNVPFTINKNGAWYMDGEQYEGTRFHKKEGVELAWGERRPKKSREMATSINTYVDFGKTDVVRKVA